MCIQIDLNFIENINQFFSDISIPITTKYHFVQKKWILILAFIPNKLYNTVSLTSTAVPKHYVWGFKQFLLLKIKHNNIIWTVHSNQGM